MGGRRNNVQTMTIEFAMVEQQVFEGLQRGNEVLAELQQELSLEDVEKLMADTAEAIAYQQVPSRSRYWCSCW